jgi:hypothetical protein
MDNSVPNLSRHVYAALNSDEHIRLIILNPSEDPLAPLECSIEQANLNDIGNVNYESISYTWGEPIFSHHLICEKKSVFFITHNLHNALKRFRLTDRARYLWADAVSINQFDLAEKSRQIPLMARIYHSASRVLVWLGNGERGESNSIDLLFRLTRSPNIAHEYISDINAAVPNTQVPLIQDLEPIRKFTGLAWFSRRWIIQEVALNPDVLLHCGTAELSWTRFILALEILNKYLETGAARPAALDSLLRLGSLWRAWSLLDDARTDCELLDLLDSFHHFGCAEERDRLFALVGLATDVRMTLHSSPKVRRMNISIDYSLSVEEVYRMYALQRMQSGRVLSTLSDAAERRPLGQSHSFPSWVPDLKMEKRHVSSINDYESSPQVDFFPENSTLLLKARIYAVDDGSPRNRGSGPDSIRIKYAGPVRKGETSQDILHWARSSYHQIKEIMTIYIYSPDRLILIVLCKFLADQADGMLALALRTVINLQGNTEPESIGYDDVDPTVEALMGVLTPMLTSPEKISPAQLALYEPILDLMAKKWKGRSLFLGFPVDVFGLFPGENTVKETTVVIGLGPEDLQQGDITISFMGGEGPYPFLLRPVGKGQYRLLGEASVISLTGRLTIEETWVMGEGPGRQVDIVLV